MVMVVNGPRKYIRLSEPGRGNRPCSQVQTCPEAPDTSLLFTGSYDSKPVMHMHLEPYALNNAVPGPAVLLRRFGSLVSAVGIGTL